MARQPRFLNDADNSGEVDCLPSQIRPSRTHSEHHLLWMARTIFLWVCGSQQKNDCECVLLLCRV